MGFWSLPGRDENIAVPKSVVDDSLNEHQWGVELTNQRMANVEQPELDPWKKSSQ